MADRLLEEDELKSLEQEIDAAVDRLFVEKGKQTALHSDSEPTLSYPTDGGKSGRESQTISSKPPSSLVAKPIEKLESQILSLEWEINRESIGKAIEEVLLLRRGYRESPEISGLLERMVAVLNVMLRQEPNIRPPLIRLLLDTMETLKLLVREDRGEELATYRRLALAGIEARFLSLEEFQEEKPSMAVSKAEESPSHGLMVTISERLDEMLKTMGSLATRLDRLSDQIERHLNNHEKRGGEIPRQVIGKDRSFKTKVTIFKAGEQLFGVESHSVTNLLKATASFCQKMNHHKTFRFKELDVKWVDLGTYFPISNGLQEKEKQLLILKEDQEYKAITMDKVVSRLYGYLQRDADMGAHVLGTIRWTYEDIPTLIPVLDVKNL